MLLGYIENRQMLKKICVLYLHKYIICIKKKLPTKNKKKEIIFIVIKKIEIFGCSI